MREEYQGSGIYQVLDADFLLSSVDLRHPYPQYQSFDTVGVHIVGIAAASGGGQGGS